MGDDASGVRRNRLWNASEEEGRRPAPLAASLKPEPMLRVRAQLLSVTTDTVEGPLGSVMAAEGAFFRND
jgi:hypothetical protein